MERNILKIALLQISPCGNLEGNLKKGTEVCIIAKQKGADIALFPEMWSNGYDIYERNPKDWKCDAIDKESDFVRAFSSLSKIVTL